MLPQSSLIEHAPLRYLGPADDDHDSTAASWCGGPEQNGAVRMHHRPRGIRREPWWPRSVKDHDRLSVVLTVQMRGDGPPYQGISAVSADYERRSQLSLAPLDRDRIMIGLHTSDRADVDVNATLFRERSQRVFHLRVIEDQKGMLLQIQSEERLASPIRDQSRPDAVSAALL